MVVFGMGISIKVFRELATEPIKKIMVQINTNLQARILNWEPKKKELYRGTAPPFCQSETTALPVS
ncbi:MAG TPA: hypothetical protein DCS28_01525 [Candidatus Moranbacteria bacterium]|nr:hypothetical protein [Candidatus Moranbacteria bacterium]HAT74705.1 hypothetical protein [Candidatus Moranbacteria bacterium]